MQKWEYQILQLIYDDEGNDFTWKDTREETAKHKRSERLNELGQDGWELVNVQNIQVAGTTRAIDYFLKRPIE